METEKLFEAIRLLSDFCKSREDCRSNADGKCPLLRWCSSSLIPGDAPEYWKDPEGGDVCAD